MRTPPHRLILDFAGVAPAVPAAIPVGRGAVERVRVASFSANPPVTRVVFDLARPVPYTLTTVGNDLHVNFAEGDEAGGRGREPRAGRAARRRAAAARHARRGRRPAPARRRRPLGAVAGPSADADAGADAGGDPAPLQRPPGQPRLPGRGPPGRAPHLLGDQRAQHRHRPGRPGHGGRGAARRAVGPGARQHPPRQQARLRRRRHDRPRRADHRPRRGGSQPAQAVRRAGAVGRAEGDDQDAQLRRRPRSSRRCSRTTRCPSAGSAAVDKRTNTIVINDLPLYLAKAEALLNSLDQSEGQVEIEARIVSTTKTFAQRARREVGLPGQAIARRSATPPA